MHMTVYACVQLFTPLSVTACKHTLETDVSVCLRCPV